MENKNTVTLYVQVFDAHVIDEEYEIGKDWMTGELVALPFLADTMKPSFYGDGTLREWYAPVQLTVEEFAELQLDGDFWDEINKRIIPFCNNVQTSNSIYLASLDPLNFKSN